MNEYSQDQQQLDDLLQRVPFTSLPWILGLLVGCVLAVAAGIALLVAKIPIEGFLRELLLHGIVLFGFFAFAFWSLLPRRKKHLENFREMQARTPIREWTYQDENWNNWLNYTEQIRFGKTLATGPRFLIFVILIVASISGFVLSLGREGASFIAAFLFSLGNLSLIATFYYLYWKKLEADWRKMPSEAKIFEDGIFFHHKFIDWKEKPDEGVLVTVETEDQPVATLSVQLQGGGSALAPHLSKFIVPIPNDQAADAEHLAQLLSQNTTRYEDNSDN